MKLLAFDCSSPWFHGAIVGGSHDTELSLRIEHGHQELVLGLLDDLMRKAGLEPRELDGVVVGKGPGSFTGVRVAMAAAKGMALALGKPLVSVSLLDAIARQYSPLPCPPSWPLVLPVLDGKKQRFYSALFDGGKREDTWLDLGPGDLLAVLGANQRAREYGVLVCGPDAEFFKASCEGIRGDIHWVNAPPQHSFGLGLLNLGMDMLKEGRVDALDQGPEYVRTSDEDLGITLKKAR